MMGELHLREVNTFALPAKLQQRDQSPIKHEPLLDSGIPVINDLRQEAVHALERTHVGFKQDQRIDFAVGLLAGFVVLLRSCRYQLLLGLLETLQETISNGLQRRDQVTLLGL